MKARDWLLAAMASLALIACLPKPAKDIEFPQFEGAIILQMKTVDEPQSEVAQRVATPSFTLYGDGTLITATPGGPLRQAHLSEGEVRNLLESLDDKGFFDFDYEQPRSPARAEGAATYFFATTKEAQNAVRACGLDAQAGEGRDWRDFRQLQDISDRLVSLEVEDARDFTPEAWVLYARRVDGTSGAPWPLETVDLTSTAPERGAAREVLTPEEASTLSERLGEWGRAYPVVQGDAAFEVGYRPVLPHEDNFPEFDLPPETEGTPFEVPLAGCG